MRVILYFFLKAIFFPIWKERNSGSKWKTPFHFSSFNFYPLFFHPNQTYNKNMRLNSIRMWCKTHVLLFQFQHAILFYHIYIYISDAAEDCWNHGENLLLLGVNTVSTESYSDLSWLLWTVKTFTILATVTCPLAFPDWGTVGTVIC